MKPLISVIVPIYNTELYLEKCIHSIIEQTYTELEILLINDGSVDHSLNICYDFAKKDNRIRVFNKKNSGVSNTRNLGIQKSRGEYILFVDSDDFIDVDYISKMYQEIEKNNYEMIISGMTFCDAQGKIIRRELYKTNNQRLILDEIMDDVINTLYFCSACKTLIKKSLIDHNHITFNEQLSFGEDFLFSYQLLKVSQKIGYLSDTGYYYRQNNMSLTHEINIEKIKKYFCDNLIIFSQFDDSVLVANRIYTKLNITIRKLASVEKINYRKFKILTMDILKLYQEAEISKDIDLNLINYESRVNYKLLLLLKNHQLYRYYLMVRIINVVKRVLRK